MPYYTIIQYVPDPVIDERINIGVIVVDGDRLICRFVSDWRRVRAFGGEDITFLQEFARQIERDTARNSESRRTRSGSSDQPGFDEHRLLQMANRWINSIQFTEPRASLLDADVLLEEVARRFLKTPSDDGGTRARTDEEHRRAFPRDLW